MSSKQTYHIMKKYIRTIDKIITPVNSKFGAPMGRSNVNTCPTETVNGQVMEYRGKLFNCAVPMVDGGAYDRGGAYWGIGRQLRCEYNKNLTYIRFYRLGDK